MFAKCPECGADWSDGLTCEAAFHQFGFWELSDLQRFGSVHHLMVLSYHLQHPSLYSPEALKGAQQQLIDFLEGGVSPEQMRRQLRDRVDSGKRAYKITGTAAHHGSYDPPVVWTLRAADVVAGGADALRRQRRGVGALDPRIAAGGGICRRILKNVNPSFAP